MLVERFITNAITKSKKEKMSQARSLQFHQSMTHTVLRGVLHNLLRSHAYEVQLRCAIKENYPPESVKYADLVLNEVDEDCFAKRVFFADDVFLHVNGHVNRHEYPAYRAEQLHKISSVSATRYKNASHNHVSPGLFIITQF
jgi:hypothetical protein